MNSVMLKERGNAEFSMVDGLTVKLSYCVGGLQVAECDPEISIISTAGLVSYPAERMWETEYVVNVVDHVFASTVFPLIQDEGGEILLLIVEFHQFPVSEIDWVIDPEETVDVSDSTTLLIDHVIVQEETEG